MTIMKNPLVASCVAGLAAFGTQASAETVGGTPAQFEVEGAVLSAHMPCAEPVRAPGEDGLSVVMCIDDDAMFVFASSIGVPADHPSALVSDFDAAYRDIEQSHDTVSIDETEIDGRRAMAAERGPESFGVMRAIQFASDGLVYAVAMSGGDGESAANDEEEQVMRAFVASLEVSE
ncbi:hypothetical protein [Qipengyuania nanhaisediminis]|uniref:hypothetical protein n=1 Tax=Qipengyuania nanhaisediminis TaxID=604088 RepID=UPI0038B350F4